MMSIEEYFKAKFGEDIKKEAAVRQVSEEKVIKEKVEKVVEAAETIRKHNKGDSPYGLTSPEELDELYHSNPELHSAIVNWN